LIDAVLGSADLSSSFRAIVSTEEVEAGKPSPAVYQEAVRRLGVTAAHAVAVEDSSNGLRSAAAAGLGVIAVPNVAFPPDDNALMLAGVVVRSLDEISPQLVVTAARTPAQRDSDRLRPGGEQD
jgi:beta-phosphoglucomutase-like phosphatase (HAD superfamily)